MNFKVKVHLQTISPGVPAVGPMTFSITKRYKPAKVTGKVTLRKQRSSAPRGGKSATQVTWVF